MLLAARVPASLLLALTPACGMACSPAAEESPATAWGNAATVEELAIGVEFGADEYMFGSVRDIAVSRDGTIYVSDLNPTIVRAYDRDGNHLRDVGGQGQGPGEYNRPPAIHVLPDGRLVTWDYGTSRVSFFSPDGEFVGSFQATSGFGGPETLQVDTEGNVYVRVFNPGASEADRLLAQYSVEGEKLGEVAFPPPDPVGRGFTLSAEGVGAPTAIETLTAWSPLGYIVTGRNDTYVIELRKPEGIVTLRRDVEPAALNGEEQAEWEAFRQTVLTMARERGVDPQYDPDPIPGTKPFFRDIFVGDEGRVWVFRCVAARKRDDVKPLPERPERPLLTWREPWTFDVFEPDGTFLGSVEMPELFEPYVFRGDRIWGSRIDGDGVERVMRLRVVPEDEVASPKRRPSRAFLPDHLETS